MSYFILKKLFLFLIIVSFQGVLFCQLGPDIRFTNISNSNGLPNNNINAITKDDLGFIWIGTSDGLCRYEGPNEFKIFQTKKPQIKGGLQSNNIRSLFLDSKNNLWIGTRLGGLTKYHQPSNTWTTYRNDKENITSLANDEILVIIEDKKGRIWVGTEDGLSVYRDKTDDFYSFKFDNKKEGTLKAKAVLSIFEDDKGWIWVGTWEGGLNLLVLPENGNIEQAKFKTFLPSEEKLTDRIWQIYQDNQNRYWIGTAGGGLFLMQLPPESNNQVFGLDWEPQFYNYSNDGNAHSITHDDIKKIHQDKNDNLWIATSNGLNFISAKQLKILPTKPSPSNKFNINFHHYFNKYSNANSLINNNVRTIFEDDQGIIWMGTFGGVSQYNLATNQFDIHELAKDITKNPIAQNLYVDPSGIVWFGNGEKGILRYDFKNHIKKDDFFEGLNKKFVSSLYSPDDKNLYIGHGGGVSVLEMRTNKIKHYPIFENASQQKHYSSTRSIFADSKNRIWIGTENGLFVINEKNGSFNLFTRDPKNPKTISDNTINQIYEDSNGTIWLSTFQGLNRVIEINSDEFEFEIFKFDSKNPNNSIPSNRIVSVTELNGILYIASTNGLSGYDLNKKIFVNYSKENNIHSFLSLEKTKEGHLWGSTTEGIVFYNTTLNIFNKYEKGDGLGGGIFCLRSSYIDKDGCLHFGSHRGLTKFDPKKIVKNKIPPSVYLTDLRKISPDGEKISNVTYNKEIVLEHNEYYLSLGYAAINYNRAEKNQYAFMLEGFDDKWRYLNKNTPAIYTNLNHGTYHFKVKASNNDGVWNELGTSVKIIKNPAFWETLLFKIGALFAGVLFLFLGIKLYTKNISNKNKILEKYNEDLNKEIAQRKMAEAALLQQKIDLRELNDNLERSNKDLEQFAYIASHDLQEPLRVVGSFISLLKRRYAKHFDEDAYQYIDFAIDGVSRMSKQIKSILSFSKVSQNDINFKLADLNEMIEINLHDLSKKIKEKNVQFKIDPLPEIICDINLIAMVFHNLMSNAIKFNKSKTPLIIISHRLSKKEGFWEFSVKDNGIGIHKDYRVKIFEIFKRLHSKKDFEGTGIGLALCKKIIHRHGGEIWLESTEGKGTTFHFTIAKNQMSISEMNLKNKHKIAVD